MTGFDFELKHIGKALSWFGLLAIAITLIFIPMIIIEDVKNEAVGSPAAYLIATAIFLTFGWLIYKLGKWTEFWIKDNTK